jgi:tetratricopeptide (TPR) repeat protein
MIMRYVVFNLVFVLLSVTVRRGVDGEAAMKRSVALGLTLTLLSSTAWAPTAAAQLVRCGPSVLDGWCQPQWSPQQPETRVDPAEQQAHDLNTSANILYEAGNYGAALTLYQQAHDLNPDDQIIVNNMNNCKDAISNRAEAVRANKEQAARDQQHAANYEKVKEFTRQGNERFNAHDYDVAYQFYNQGYLVDIGNAGWKDFFTKKMKEATSAKAKEANHEANLQRVTELTRLGDEKFGELRYIATGSDYRVESLNAAEAFYKQGLQVDPTNAGWQKFFEARLDHVNEMISEEKRVHEEAARPGWLSRWWNGTDAVEAARAEAHTGERDTSGDLSGGHVQLDDGRVPSPAVQPPPTLVDRAKIKLTGAEERFVAKVEALMGRLPPGPTREKIRGAIHDYIEGHAIPGESGQQAVWDIDKGQRGDLGVFFAALGEYTRTGDPAPVLAAIDLMKAHTLKGVRDAWKK